LNEEKVIEDTLKSLRELKDYAYEIIVADGGSKDKTVEIAIKNNARVVIHKGPTTQTISSNRNLGASIAIGDFFVFMDADTIIPDINIFFKKALALFESQKKLVGLSVRIKVYPAIETLSDKIFFTTNDCILFISNNIFGSGRSSGKFQMIKASVFKKLKGYNEKIVVCEDVELFQRVAREGKTRIEMSLNITHTGRRAHEIGWPKLLLKWWMNGMSVSIFNRSFNTTWEEIR
jgi:glycosyltransferase involved in cell wall biosynthesis